MRWLLIDQLATINQLESSLSHWAIKTILWLVNLSPSTSMNHHGLIIHHWTMKLWCFQSERPRTYSSAISACAKGLQWVPWISLRCLSRPIAPVNKRCCNMAETSELLLKVKGPIFWRMVWNMMFAQVAIWEFNHPQMLVADSDQLPSLKSSPDINHPHKLMRSGRYSF